jgi:hypothetical protein
MKKILMILLIIILVVLAAYAVTHLHIRASLNERFCLWEKQSAIIKSEGLKITLINAIYSPCPKNAMCFWSGVGADLNISYAGNSTRILGTVSTDAFGYKILVSDISSFRSCFIVNKME